MPAISPHQTRQMDSVRGLSALIVLVGHAYQTFINPIFHGASTVVGFFTQFAVMVFFSLSGFLVGTSIFRNIRRNKEFQIRQYAYDRALRIYPPLIAATLLMIAVWKLAPYLFPSGTSLFAESAFQFARQGIVTNFKEILGSLFFLNGFKTLTPGPNGPLWSLSYEIWYYIIAGLAFMVPRHKALAIVLLVAALYLTRKNHQFLMLSVVWAAGLGIAWLRQNDRLPSVKALRVAAWILGALSIITMACVLKIKPGGSAWLTPWNYYMIVSGCWFTTLLSLALQKAISLPSIFHKSAAYSYTLYIVHFPIMLLIFGIFQETILGSLSAAIAFAAGSIITCVALSAVMAKVVENKRLLEIIFPRPKLQMINK